MTRRTIAIVTGAVALLAGVLLFGELPAESPGALASSHADLDLSCRACHSPFQAASDGCVQCHGGLPPANKHADLALACGGCHAEHRGTEAKLIANAGADCTSCHAHPSIRGVEQHRQETIGRPLELNAHVIKFSHRVHFDEIEDQGLPGDPHDCERCHVVGAAVAEAGARGEHALRWSGCRPCHDDWHDAGLPQRTDVAAEAAIVQLDVFFSPARLGRIRFRHSAGHLASPCGDCHVQMTEAEEVPASQGGSEEVVVAAKRVLNCFGCHAHSPDGPAPEQADVAAWRPRRAEASERWVGRCAQCHEFHGSGAAGDFPAGPSDEPRARAWDVLAKTGGLVVTPWLLAFLGVGIVGFVAVVRAFPSAAAESQQANEDVAPQRVSEVPALEPTGESSVPGLYIVGELAGVPLINRAMKSGFDAIDFIANRLQTEGRSGGDDAVDVLIAGAGPAGLGAATKAKSLGLSYVLCEKSTAAATIKNYPRAKVVQAAPIDIPEYGTFFQDDDESKEGLVRRWEDIIARSGVVVNEREQVVDVRRDGNSPLVIRTQDGKTYRSRFGVLAIGVRGTPRPLGLSGETPERVFYLLVDPDEYRERRILVVGGGNAACEAALALSNPELLNHVTLSHRGSVLKGVTPQNSQAVDNAEREGQLDVVRDSTLKEVRASSVILTTPNGEREIDNDVIFAMIGAELPTKFLRDIGVKLARKGGA